MKTSKRLDLSVSTGAILGCLVAINVVGLGLFGRLDLTRDKEFTLSKATKATLKELKDPLTVRAYFTKDVPPPYSTNARYVRDLLDEYYAAAGGNFRYEFIDPLADDPDKDKKAQVKRDIFGRAVREATPLERDLQALGIPSFQVEAGGQDKVEVKRAYAGIAVTHGDKKDVIPVVQRTVGLEYDLTTLIRKMTRSKTPKVGLVAGFEGNELHRNLGRLQGLLRQLYDVTPVDLSGATPKIPDDADALLVISPRTPLSDAAVRAVDSFVMSGRAAAFLLDAVRVDLSNLETTDVSHGLTALLTTYGATIQPGLVLDKECAKLNVTHQQGFMRITQPVDYPFLPFAKRLDAQHSLTRGIAQVAFPFMSPLSVSVPAGSEVKAEVIARSSPNSWVASPPYNVSPFQQWLPDQSSLSSKDLVVALTGPIKSHFAAAEAAPLSSNPSSAVAAAKNGRVLVAGGASFAFDEFMSKPNEALLLNLMDWLVLDDALLAVRSRGLSAAPLKDVGDGARRGAKYANILGVPLVFVGVGIVRWRRREATRSRAAF